MSASETKNDVENVIIIGSGPAGHTAALYTSRANLNPLMFEGFMAGGTPGGQLMITTEVENYPGFPEGVTGPDLMAHMRKQSERFGTRIMTQDVQEVDTTQRPFKVVSEGKEYFANSLIIATGASAKYLGLENEKRLMNRGVSACATCDGALPLFRNKPLAVIGGGDTAMEEAMFLTKFASKVYLIHRREEFRASKIMLERAQAHEKIEFVVNTVVDDVQGDDVIQSLKLRNTKNEEVMDLEVAGMFVAIGHKPNTDIFGEQLEKDDTGYLVTQGKSSYTSVEGVFACGDVQDKIYRQAITAAGSGCTAAIDAERWLAEQGLH
ncbi:MAG: thioredoxin-disulfide reductase [Myxococcota bacterium]